MARFRRLLSRIPLAFILMAVSLPAWAQFPRAYSGPGRYEIENIASGKALDADIRDGRTLRQWTAVHQGDQPNPPNNLRNQQWDIEDAGYGFVRIKSAQTGSVLDVEQPNVRAAVPVFLSRPGNAETQLWKIEELVPGEVKIISRLGKSLDLPDGSHSNGTHLQIFPSNPGDNQKFRFFRVDGPRRSEPDFQESRFRDRIAPDRLERHERGEAERGEAERRGGTERDGYDLGYGLGLDDSRSQLRRSYARHKGQYHPQFEEAFIEGYYDGYDNGREGSSRMRDTDRDPYDAGYRLGRQDSQESRRPDYMRYADRFDPRSEPFFRRGYADGYHAAP